jgi:hypothetical protein
VLLERALQDLLTVRHSRNRDGREIVSEEVPEPARRLFGEVRLLRAVQRGPDRLQERAVVGRYSPFTTPYK